MGNGRLELDRQHQIEHLAQANQHIGEGQLRVKEQQLRLNALKQRGFDVSLAEKLLETLENTLCEWRAHREEILKRIAAIDAAKHLPGS